MPLSPTKSPKETVFTDGQKHFDVLLSDIKSAKHSIDLETYLFHNDILGKRVALELSKAAKRGVNVRVMVDGIGSPLWSANFARFLEEAGVKTKVFHPFPWQLWDWSRSIVKLPSLIKWIYLVLKINFRNHRKVCIIDKEIAYIGSLNISKYHLSPKEGGEGWRDTSVRLTGINLKELTKAFNAAWYHRTIKERLREIFYQIRKDPLIRLNYTRQRRRVLYKNLLQKMANCTYRIWITNAYFIPDTFLLGKLKEAAYSGIDVRILLPRKSDIAIMPWASSTFYYNLLKSGVRIFEYLPSMLHAKSLIIDDWMVIGSSNLNHRSLIHDLEVDIHINSKESKRALEKQFLEDLKNSREVSLNSWQILRPRIQRLMGRLVLYIKYWI
ncbi:phospholipase D-like domain-containing protein [Coxiella endosymbiont of Amblyomma americanum]|uniref:phospholipase D-like domain-containing protein n=1 Tax=Coxiella endosymbiont of Amblyomma americanum TaxID=325775 RepID=UPI00057CE774|nr:phospholipase D-like domain-containing protein [Coxiella endosymbiont of Amblyomma americanum]AJC50380.1 cardiolipin synthetase [Coxiella endosymbiont of Amblyomma americanum]AUJ58722.1 cardiolipin synthase B [Coxiella-like endosymbiont of Amblyomma americanum]